MKLPDSFLEEVRARTPLAALVGRTVKLSRSGRQMKGCCPFHAEKTPSFYVYDDGYHCFGCGAHGDAIGFVMQTGNRSFIEAVQTLAAEAGLEMPRAEPGADAAERQRLDLQAVLDAAGAFYARRLARRTVSSVASRRTAMSGPTPFNAATATSTQAPAGLALNWKCPSCGKVRAYEGGRPGEHDECGACGGRVATETRRASASRAIPTSRYLL